MFLKETTETNTYERKSKFGKFAVYNRVKTFTHWQCDNCGIEFTKGRNGKYSTEVKSYCKGCIAKIGVNKLASMAGYESKVTNTFLPNVGKVVDNKEGYQEIYIGKNYPYRSGGYRTIRMHVYVMEMHLGRRLTRGEVVHHIDGNKKNNDIENLFLTTVAEHNKLHAASEGLIFELVKTGVVKFNKSSARYELSKEQYGTICNY